MDARFKTDRRIVLLVPPQVHLLDINGIAHVFYEAKEFGAPLSLTFMTMSDVEVESSAGLSFARLTHFREIQLKDNDLVCIPGLAYSIISDEHFLKEAQSFFDWLQAQYAQGVSICSVCTGAFLLAESGLLDGKKCTTHWKYCDLFSQRFPKISLEKERLFVTNEKLYTSAGVSSGIDLGLFLLEEWYGSKFAADVAKEIVIFFRRGEADPQLNIFLQYKNHLNHRIHTAQEFIIQHFSEGIKLEDIANEVYMSVRNFTRQFKQATGITVGLYIEKLRIEKAVRLLSEDARVEDIAHQCGLKSTNQLRSLLKKHEGVLPSSLK